MFVRHRLVVAALLGSGAGIFVADTAWAQEIVPSESADAYILVTGGALPDRSESEEAVVIDRDALDHIASGRVENALKDIAGLQQFRRSDARSAHPTSQGMTMRGLGGNAASRVVVILDGVPITDPFGGWVNWPSIQAGRLGAIQVRRGGGTLSQGAGAVAGTIQLFSENSPADHAALEGSLFYGSRDSIAAQGIVSGKLGEAGAGLIAAQFERSDGFIPVVAGQRGSADKRAPYQQGSVVLRGVVDAGASRELQVNLSGFTDERNRGTDFTDNRTIGSDMSLRLVDRGSLPWSAMVYGQVREMRSGFASVNADRSVATQTLDQYRVPATGWGAAFILHPAKGVQLGADARFMSGESRERYTFVNSSPTRLRRAGGDARTIGAHVALSYNVFHALAFDASARLDHWRISNGVLDERSMAGAVINDIHHPNRDDWEPSASAGLTFRPIGNVRLRASGYTNWRLPTLNELYRPYRVGADAIAANPDLSPERVKGGEIGASFDNGKARMGVTLFANRLDKAIANVTLARGPGVFPGVGFVSGAGTYKQRRNLDAIKAKGVEVDAHMPFAPGWSLGASYAYTDAKVEASGIAFALDGLRPAQVAKHSGSARLDWAGDKADVFVTMRYSGKQFEDDQNSIRLNDALTFDAGVSVPVVGGLRLDVRGENLADKRVEAARSSTGIVERATPRTIWLGVSFKR